MACLEVDLAEFDTHGFNFALQPFDLAFEMNHRTVSDLAYRRNVVARHAGMIERDPPLSAARRAGVA
jgi:hypothetical protein